MRIALALIIYATLLGPGHTASAQGIDPHDYRLFLVPLAVNDAPGAYGTIWRTELSVYHDGDVPPSVVGYNTQGDPFVLFTRHTYSPPLFLSTAGDPPGTLIYVSKALASQTHFDLRVSNDSPHAVVTTLPVVSEDGLLQGRAVLLRVQGGNDRRRMLRIYAPLSDIGVTVRVSVSDEATGAEIGQQLVTLQTSPASEVVDGVTFRLHPTAGQISLDAAFPGIASYQSVTVLIEPLNDALAFWAFVAVTDNTTQQVTAILPN